MQRENAVHEREAFEHFIKRLKATLGSDLFDKYFVIPDGGHAYTLTSNFKDQALLNISVTMSAGDVVITYENNSYSNRSELWPPNNASSESVGNDIFNIVNAYLRQGARRWDKYIGGKLVSSTLEVDGQDKTQAVKSFKLFGKREIKTIVYAPPLPDKA